MSRQVDASDILLAYRNFGNVDLWGADISTEVLLTDAWSLKGSASWVNTDCFDFDQVAGCAGLLDVSLNAPQTKGSLGVRYRDAAHDFTAELQGRFIEGFPMNTGVFIGRVPGYGSSTQHGGRGSLGGRGLGLADRVQPARQGAS